MKVAVHDCGALLRAFAEGLAVEANDAAALHGRLLAADPGLRVDLPSCFTTLNDFAYKASALVLQRACEHKLAGLTQLTPLVHLSGFLRALLRIDDRLASRLQLLLEGDLPSRGAMLAKIEPGPDMIESLVHVLLDWIRRPHRDAIPALCGLAHGLLRQATTLGVDAAPLGEWLQKQGVVSAPAGVAPALRVISVRLVSDDAEGWTVHWVRGVCPGAKILDFPTNQRIRTIDALWGVLRGAIASFKAQNFFESTDQVILRIEAESERALEGFHRATDPRSAMKAWSHFRAVTLWPWLEHQDDLGGFRHDGPLHRPTESSPSDTMVLRCCPTETEALAKCSGRRVLVCTEPVWQRDANGLSPAIETQENRALAVLLAGDGGESFLDYLFACDQTRPFADVFAAIQRWLLAGEDAHVLWTDPDYLAYPAPLRMLA
ncbi:hypothetical protein [Nannocystis radixulma]|uniref:Uncharacterized protein n=1 Tax=Nannocystis radixulma TaxID=2995305 RepID=A0ABT5BLZ4_9BACT|nr:hypothetical protein [Nannocystis radixulma]MDC0675176.1 hypothetical protein [Nannocystis radixulma]